MKEFLAIASIIITVLASLSLSTVIVAGYAAFKEVSIVPEADVLDYVDLYIFPKGDEYGTTVSFSVEVVDLEG